MIKKLLVIDDSELVLKSLYSLFKDEYNVLITDSPEEGLELIKKHEIQVVLCDYQLTTISGIEFFISLKNQYPDIIRVLITGYPELDQIIKAINLGDIYRYIRKPWDSFEIKNIIREAFEKNNLIVQNKLLVEQLKVANAKLEKKEKFLTTITDIIPERIGYWTQDLINHFANNQYYFLYKKTAEEIYGMHMKDLLGDKLFSQTIGFAEKALNGERVDFEGTQLNADGEVINFWAHYIPDIENEVVKGFFVSVSDITEIKKSHIQLEKLNQELKELNLTKDKFFSIIAHDLRSPFNGFIGLTEILSEDIENMTLSEIKVISNQLKDSSKNLFKLLENLLEWSRMQNGTMEFNPDFCIISYIVKQNLKYLNEFAKQKQIELITNISEKIRVLADIGMVNTVLRNLISNAIKFTHRKGKVIISAEEKENEIIISVQDSGIGMNSEMISKLFNIDKKNSRPGTEGESSTGLGLLLCKEFIEKHNGKIWVESVVGIGSTFYFSLPKN